MGEPEPKTEGSCTRFWFQIWGERSPWACGIMSLFPGMLWHSGFIIFALSSDVYSNLL